jgi:tetratricopeptide (TPR) repeat protein
MTAPEQAREEPAEEITVQTITRERPPLERALIWALRRWWALALAIVGGAIVSELTNIGTAIFNEIVNQQPIALPPPQSSIVGTLFTKFPLLTIIGLVVVAALTVVAYFADRAEQTRLARLAAEAEERARIEHRREVRAEAAAVLQEFFQQQRAQKRLAGEGEEDDAEGGASARPIVLPPRPALVVGRDADLERIAVALRDPAVSAVALRGMGGVGKSTLLLETLYRQKDAQAYPGGIIWLSCQELVDDDCETQLYDAAGIALGLSEVAKAENAHAKAQALRRGVAGRAILIGLDNVEQQMPLAHILTTLAARGANGVGPMVLISTRVNWADVPGLREIDLDVLAPDEGYVLLRRLVERGGKTIGPEDESAARAIVAAVGALPLALELVAPRIVRRAEPLAALADRLRDEGVDLKGRARSIERTFDLTYEQLTPAEQKGFSALAVLAGASFSQEAALDVMMALIGADATPQVLLDLADLSLLREVAQPSGPPRYQLHPLVRQFARERLRRQGEQAEQEAELAAAKFYRGFAHRRMGRRIDTYNLLDVEYANILGALTWAYQTMKTTRDPARSTQMAQLVGDTVADIRGYMQDRGHWTDGRRVLRWGIEADSRLGNQIRQSSTLATLGFIVRQQGDLDEAEGYYKQALNLARARHDKRGEAARIHNLGTVALQRGDLPRARALYEEALALRRAMDEAGGMSATLRSLGALAAEQGDWDQARRYLRESLELKRVQGISRGRTFCELGIVQVRDPQGDRTQARNLLQTALDIARQFHVQNDEARALDWLGALDLAQGDIAGARANWEAALTIYSELGAVAASETRARLAKLGAPTPVAVGA